MLIMNYGRVDGLDAGYLNVGKPAEKYKQTTLYLEWGLSAIHL